MNDKRDPRIAAIPDVHGHAKGEHKPYAEERPIPLSARMLFLWFFHACRRGHPRFMMVSDHMNYLTFEDPAAVNLVRRALKLAQAGDLYGAAETANVDVAHARVVHDGLRRGMRYSIGAEVDNDPRCRPDAQNIVDSMKPDGMIRSVHFLPIDHPQHGAGWMWGFDNPEFAALWEHVGIEKAWELYIAAVLDAIERLPGQILGHFYVAASFGHWPDDAKLEEYEDRVIDALLARGMAFELNSRFIYRHPEDDENRAKYIAANTRMLRKAKAKGVLVTTSSDAHSPRDQGNGYEIVLQMLDDAGVNELVFPIAGKFARVQLRAEKPAEPEIPEAAPVVVAEAPAAPPQPKVAATNPDESDAIEDVVAETKPRTARAGSTRTTASPAVRTGTRRTNARAAETALDETPPPSAESPVEPKPKSKAKIAPVAAPEPAAEIAPAVEFAPEPMPAPEPISEAPPAPGEAKTASAVKAPAAPKPAPAKKAAPVKAAPARVAAPARPSPSAKAKAPAKAAPVKAKPAPAKHAAPAKPAAKPARAAATAKKAATSSAKAKPVAKKTAPAKTSAKAVAKVKPKAKPPVKTAAKAPAAKAKPRSAKIAAKPVAKATKTKTSVRASAKAKPAAKKTAAKKAPPKRR